MTTEKQQIHANEERKKCYIDIDKTCDFGSQCPVLSSLKVFLPVFLFPFLLSLSLPAAHLSIIQNSTENKSTFRSQLPKAMNSYVVISLFIVSISSVIQFILGDCTTS